MYTLCRYFLYRKVGRLCHVTQNHENDESGHKTRRTINCAGN